ncbi:hypothetical protein pb186bvf_009526 [Paramecium bursaria]
MIKKFTLTFISHELEKSYKIWMQPECQFRLNLTIGLLILYLTCFIIYYSQNNNIAGLISSIVTLSIQLTIAFFSNKYKENIEIMIAFEQVVFGIFCEIVRIYNTDDFLNWQLGFQFSIIRLALYLQGLKFIGQSFLLILCFGASLIQNDDYSIILSITYMEILVISIIIKYIFDRRERQFFVANQQYQQYENIIEDVLPAWVVLVKYDKYKAQLKLDKANKDFKDKQGIQSGSQFRDFLRKLIISSDNKMNNQDQIKLEHDLIRLLQQRSQEKHEIKKYYAVLEGEKKKVFKISQVYFYSFEPTVLLLFEELIEDKYDSLQLQIVWRDQQATNNAKLNIKIFTDHIAFLKILRHQINNWCTNKPQLANLLLGIDQQILKGYLSFNQSLNIFNLSKISYNQIKYDINEFDLFDLIKQIKEDLGIYNNQKIHVVYQRQMAQIKFFSDKSKLISIILSILEFIRIMISLKDESQLFALHPHGSPIQLKAKVSQIHANSYCFTLSHQKLQVPLPIQECLNKNQTGSDHKKCNWGASHYFQNVKRISEKIANYINEKPEMNNEYSFNTQNIIEEIQSQTNIKQNLSQTEPFSTMGLPLAQYFISQLGPSNKLMFAQCRNRSIKIKFYVYQDLKNFITQLNQQQPNTLFDLFVKPKSITYKTQATKKFTTISQFSPTRKRQLS